MMLKRCGYDPSDYFDVNDFSNIVEYNTTETISRFGIAMSDIAEVELHEIYTTVLDIQKNQKRTFEQNNIKISGVILNKAEIQGNSYYSFFPLVNNIVGDEFEKYFEYKNELYIVSNNKIYKIFTNGLRKEVSFNIDKNIAKIIINPNK